MHDPVHGQINDLSARLINAKIASVSVAAKQQGVGPMGSAAVLVKVVQILPELLQSRQLIQIPQPAVQITAAVDGPFLEFRHVFVVALISPGIFSQDKTLRSGATAFTACPGTT